LLDRRSRIGDFHDQLLVALMLERHDESLRRIADIPEYELAVEIKGARCKEARQFGAHHLEAVPPATDLIGVQVDPLEVRQRDLQAAAERPQLVESLHLENDPVALDCDVNHQRILRPAA
jgi:hypothetical protein